MSIEFDCICGQRLRVSEDHSGKRAKCSKCGVVLDVPQEIVAARQIVEPLEVIVPATIQPMAATASPGIASGGNPFRPDGGMSTVSSAPELTPNLVPRTNWVAIVLSVALAGCILLAVGGIVGFIVWKNTPQPAARNPYIQTPTTFHQPEFATPSMPDLTPKIRPFPEEFSQPLSIPTEPAFPMEDMFPTPPGQIPSSVPGQSPSPTTVGSTPRIPRPYPSSIPGGDFTVPRHPTIPNPAIEAMRRARTPFGSMTGNQGEVVIEITGFEGNVFVADHKVRAGLISLGWLDMSRIKVDLEGGEIVAGVRRTNVDIDSERVKTALEAGGFSVSKVTYHPNGRPESKPAP